FVVAFFSAASSRESPRAPSPPAMTACRRVNASRDESDMRAVLFVGQAAGLSLLRQAGGLSYENTRRQRYAAGGLSRKQPLAVRSPVELQLRHGGRERLRAGRAHV